MSICGGKLGAEGSKCGVEVCGVEATAGVLNGVEDMRTEVAQKGLVLVRRYVVLLGGL